MSNPMLLSHINLSFRANNLDVEINIKSDDRNEQMPTTVDALWEVMTRVANAAEVLIDGDPSAEVEGPDPSTHH